MLASLLYPYDSDAGKRMDGWLDELQRERCVVRYVVNGDQYIAIVAFQAHQRIDKPSASKLPEPPEPPEPSESPREDSRILLQGSENPPATLRRKSLGREGKGREGSAPAPEISGPTETHRALAAKLGVDCDSEWAGFNDRIAAKGKAWFTNKDAAFSGWLRQERKFAERDGRVVLPSQPKRVSL